MSAATRWYWYADRQTWVVIDSESGDYRYPTSAELAEVSALRAVGTPMPPEMHEERDWFKAEMEAFMHAAAANHGRGVLLEGLLRECEWIDTHDGDAYTCPVCGGLEVDGHDPKCRLAAALAVPAAGREGDVKGAST